MCGIVGLIGKHQAAPIIVDALRRLEYRGYDSAGVATISNGKLDRRRAVGKLVELADLLVTDPIEGKIGIGHTRWATHGKPNANNAHPHMSDGVAVVHNGIIENFGELRVELERDGYVFATETDTETVAHFCARELKAGKTPQEAVKATLQAIDGAFSLAFIFDGYEDLLIVARQGSPLAIGYGDDEMFVGSDAIALANLTDKLCYLEEGDWAVLTHSGAAIYDSENQPVDRAITLVNIGEVMADKGNYRHYMLKEIHEQPTVLSYMLNNYLTRDRKALRIDQIDVDLSSYDRVQLVACGTAYYACFVAKYWIEHYARIPVEIEIASEFRYREPPLSPNSLAIFVSQSGETADTLAALKYCKGKVKNILSIVNVPQSSIARESDYVLQIYAGAEIGVASTKAFTCQLGVLAALTIQFGKDHGLIDPQQEAQMVASLEKMPGLFNMAMSVEKELAHIGVELAKARDILFLGRGALYPLALEGALKLKEISYIHAEGYASGELKHGPIALIDELVPIVVFAPNDDTFEKTISNMQEVMARDGKVILVSDEKGLEAAGEGVWHKVKMPEVDSFTAPILYSVAAQLIAYQTAIAKGTDVDQPRNLAKSVTVE